VRGERVRFEDQAIGKDGRRIEVEFRGMPVQYHGRPHVLTIRTISLSASRRKPNAPGSKPAPPGAEDGGDRHLTGGIAHDFNNLLTTIMGYIVLANERQAAAGDARLQLPRAGSAICERART